MVGHRSAPPDGAESLCTRQHRFMLLGMLPVFFLLFFLGGGFRVSLRENGERCAFEARPWPDSGLFLQVPPPQKKEAKNNWHVV